MPQKSLASALKKLKPLFTRAKLGTIFLVSGLPHTIQNLCKALERVHIDTLDIALDTSEIDLCVVKTTNFYRAFTFQKILARFLTKNSWDY